MHPDTADLRPGWRGVVAHVASPWRWGRAWFAVYLAGLVTLVVVWSAGALTAPVSGPVRVVELLLAIVATTFLAIRPGLRAVRLRAFRTSH